MTWIQTIPPSEANEELQHAFEALQSLYPPEYAAPVLPDDAQGAAIMAAHTLLPQALYHNFSTLGVLFSPELPLTRRQHEMINMVVSVTNRCFY